MKSKLKFTLAVAPVIAAATLAAWLAHAQKPAPRSKPKLAVAIKPQHLTDALNAVIAAQREVYARTNAPRFHEPGFPNPCAMFRLISEATASRGVEFAYVLRSLKPSSPRNAPETDVERKGLESVAARPEQARYAEEMLGGRWYFTAVYPDVAVHQSCVTCHNQLHGSPRTDFKPGEVMGGVVIRVALEL
jgi:hypothetical protein